MEGVNVEKIQETMAELSKPFDVRLVEFRPGSVRDDKAKPLPYVSVIHYLRRLQQVCPGSFQIPMPTIHIASGKVVIAQSIFLAGLEFSDVGESDLLDKDGNSVSDASPSAWGQALKRACRQFGLGAYLYLANLDPVSIKYKKLQIHPLVLASDWYLQMGYPVEDEVLDMLEELRSTTIAQPKTTTTEDVDKRRERISRLEQFNKLPASYLHQLTDEQLKSLQLEFINAKNTGKTREQILKGFPPIENQTLVKRPWN